MNYFDAHAKNWDDSPMRGERAHETFLAIKRNLPFSSDTKCMEFGCGTGVLSFQFQPWVKSIDLVDTSEGMLDVLKSKIADFGVVNMIPVLADYTQIQPEQITEKYDLIYTLMSLHHVVDYDRLLKQLYLTLLSGGYVCIADLVTEDGSFHQNSPDFDGHNGFDREILQQKMEEAGFAVVSYSVYYKVEKEGRSYPLFLMIGRK